ncbi:uncharacterized protein LOC131479515 [Ochotona princeps]|uniref:uncharacterized protein LOC131479515 n=1 Tax=Ochotona princeps TaxID=9978 RepID=UPI0027155838|nr:uncharacterized protein LOC131479515 [Ochotona princeps]
MDCLSGSCWFSIQILALSIRLLLGFPAVKDPSSSCTLNRTTGESVQLTLNSSPDPNIREIEWSWEPPSKERQLLVSWILNAPGPDWYDIKDLKNRFNLTKLAFLIIMNVTVEMSGLYTAEIKFHSEQSQVKAFRLCVYGFQAVKDPSSSCTLNRTVGGSVQLTLNSSPDPNIREIEWSWEPPSKKRQLLVSWRLDAPGPDWYQIKDLKNRFNLTKLAFLIIMNVTVEMSGLYTAEIKFHSGQSQVASFRLCVYEPVPHPQIKTHFSSSTSGWCNITFECDTPGYTEDLTVSWMSNDLGQNGTLGPTPYSKNLSLSLPIDQWNGHLICVVSNPADQKNGTLDLKDICPQKGHPQSNWLWKVSIFLGPLVGLGIILWICRWRKMKTDRAAARQALHTVDCANQQTGGADSLDTPYAEIGLLTQPKNDTEASSCHARRSELTPAVHTIYKELHMSPKPRGDT